MSDPTKLTLTLRLTDGYGVVHGCLAREVPDDAAFMGTRLAGDLRFANMAGLGSLEKTINVLKTREFRKSLLQECARNLGARLAEYLEDKEGWHGIERQEGILAAEKERP